MSGNDKIEVSVLASVSEISSELWDACACPETQGGGRPIDPFTTHRFLKALEDSGSVGTGTGWLPYHLVAKIKGQVIAVMPTYAKGHSQGEYIFDHNWAHAYENAGGQYYPKLQVTVPFTPATGRRILTLPGLEETGRIALLQGAIQLADQNTISSVHITFCTQEEAAAGEKFGLLSRTTQQFHWHNNTYQTFDDFLADLSSRKRKAIRKERAKAQAFGGSIHQLTGRQIMTEHWDAFWEFYQDTGARKWGHPYLTRDFFSAAQEYLRDDILLVLCESQGRWVAGALNFVGRNRLYGRYWGCCEDHRFMHFELCYYQAIDFAISHSLTHVEAGAQGEHKLARGYTPVPVYSLHWIADPGFRKAIGEYLKAEKQAVSQDIDILTSYGPFKQPQGEKHD